MKHVAGRPPAEAQDVLALTPAGKWVADDGEPHLAFSYQISHPRRGWPNGKGGITPYAISSECDCTDDCCPKRKAMRLTASRFGAANGVDF
jgi:hypothetical protein